VIVYGDPDYIIRPEQLLPRLSPLIEKARFSSLDAARDLLIACGQIEQAISDVGIDDSTARQATNRAADYFLNIVRAPAEKAGAREFSLSSVQSLLTQALAAAPSELRIKIPEGCAFYCLYPEQYASAAQQWSTQHEPGGDVLVVGIRSIGTNLSALVASALNQHGHKASRVTVRPGGHPFAREVELPAFTGKFSAALVVDEGPGLSGSSIAAVIRALKKSGIRDNTIFPSHAGAPGEAASPEVREIWKFTPRIVTPVLTKNWEENFVFADLKSTSERLLQSVVVESLDLSSGLWRDLFKAEHPYPSAPAFERTKYLLRAENGRGMLWKFAGLGCGRGMTSLADEAWDKQKQLAEEGWCPLPAAQANGFIGTEWIDATPVTCAEFRRDPDRSSEILSRYILAAANPPLSRVQITENAGRLQNMTVLNIREALGENHARQVPNLADRLETLLPLPSYGDGRLGPHEWLSFGNQPLKADIWGHDADHTCVGQQSILWDIAGAMMEWEMTQAQKTIFCNRFADQAWPIDLEALRFHLLAYCAFQTGVASFCGDRERTEKLKRRITEVLGEDTG